MNSQLGNLILWAIVAALAVLVIQSASALPEEPYRIKRIFCNFEGCGNHGKRAEEPQLAEILEKQYNLEARRSEPDVYTANDFGSKDSRDSLLSDAKLWKSYISKMRSLMKRHAPRQQ